MSTTLRDWLQGQSVSAAHLQEIVEFGRRLGRVMGWDISKGDGGVRGNLRGIVRFGVIVTAGPAGEADFSDNRYWVREAYAFVDSDSDENDSTLKLAPLPDVPLDTMDGVDVTVSTIGCVHNLPELLDGSHSLREGQAVVFFVISDYRPVDSNGEPYNSHPRYIMAVGGLPPIQYQYMVIEGVGNGKAGADNVRAHPLMPDVP